MELIPSEIPEVLIIEPKRFEDQRGFFLETYQQERYQQAGITDVFTQDNHSASVGGALRGLHSQCRHAQAKLLRCIEGEIFDVAVDIRLGSPTFGQYVGVSLSADNFRQLYIPAGFAHGFAVLSKKAQVEYKCSNTYQPEDEITVLWNDPAIGIQWPITDPILSEKDRNGLPLEAHHARLPQYSDLQT